MKDKQLIPVKPEQLTEAQSSYEIDGRRFVVTSTFREDGRETFGTILLRLMQAEAGGVR